MTEQFEIGIITSTHGLKGEVKVFPTTDDVNRFYDLDDVLLETREGFKALSVERVRFFKGRPILKFRGLNRIEDVEGFRSMKLLVNREQAIPLEENEYYIADILGSTVYLEDGSMYGMLNDVLKTGANDVYVIDHPDGSVSYLPAIHDCILELNIEDRRIVVRPMKEV